MIKGELEGGERGGRFCRLPLGARASLRRGRHESSKAGSLEQEEHLGERLGCFMSVRRSTYSPTRTQPVDNRKTIRGSGHGVILGVGIPRALAFPPVSPPGVGSGVLLENTKAVEYRPPPRSFTSSEHYEMNLGHSSTQI